MSALPPSTFRVGMPGEPSADAVAAEVDEGLQQARVHRRHRPRRRPRPGGRGASRQPRVLRAARRRQAALQRAGGRARLDRARRRGQRLRRGHRDPAGPQGELQPGRRDGHRRSRRRPNLVRAQRLARRGAGAARAGQRVHRRDAPRVRRPARAVRPRAGTAVESVGRAGGPADVDDEHQSLPARQRRRRTRTRAVPHRPAHRLRHRHRAGPRTGSRWAAGVFGSRRLGGRAVGSGRTDGQHR